MRRVRGFEEFKGGKGVKKKETKEQKKNLPSETLDRFF
jgi:hypothetical protein